MSAGVKDFRERVGIKTQSALAKMLGINPTNVSEWEASRGTPSYAVLKKLFEMGATVEELFGIAYKGQGGGAVDLASLSDSDAAALVKRGLAELAGARG